MLSWTLLAVVRGRWRRVGITLWVLSALFVVRYVFA